MAQVKAKRSTVKKVTKTRKPKEDFLEESTYQSSTTHTTSTSPFKKPQLYIGLVLILLALGFLFKSQFVVAMVNGQPVSRMEFNQALEQQDGKQVLTSIITQKLIYQEANKRHITVSQQEIDDQMKKINSSLAAQGQTLDQALALRGMSKADFTNQLKIQLLAEKMLGNTIKVTDQEVNDYIEKNKDSLPQDANPDDIKASVKQQLEQQKLSDAFQGLVTKLQKDAKINYFVNFQ